MALVQSIVRAGVSIVTMADGQRYEAGQRLQTTQLLILLIGSEQNHKQSEDKSRRLREGYALRRTAARENGRVMTGMAPPWLTLTKDRRWKVIDDRAALIREIYGWADDGLGKLNITRRLNERGEKAWRKAGRGGAERGWYASMINRLLTNPAVIGEFQPHRREGDKSVPDGLPIRDYYPQIIDPALFARVTLGAKDRKEVRGRRSDEMRNLVSGLATCSVCNSALVLRTTRRNGDLRTVNGVAYPLKSDDSRLICSNHQRKGGCSNAKSIPYGRLEKNLLNEVLHLALDDAKFADDREAKRLRSEVAEIERELQQATTSAEAMWRAWSANPSDMRMRLAEEAENRAEALKARLGETKADLTRALGQVSNAEHLARVSAVRETLGSDNDQLRAEARIKVATALRSIITFIELDGDGVTTIAVAGGLAAFRLTGRTWERADAFAFAKAGFTDARKLHISEQTFADVVRRATSAKVE